MFRKINPTFIRMLILLSIILTATFADARGFRHHSGAAGKGFGLRQLFKLDLSDEQKAQVKAVLDKYQPEREALRGKVREARQGFRAAVEIDQFNETEVRQAFQEMVPLLEERAVLQAKIASELRSILTEEQRDRLAEKKAERAHKRQERRKFRQAFVETWRQMQSE